MRRALLVVGFSISLLPRVAPAQWQFHGTPLSTAANSQYDPTIVSDGAGGAIVTWTDFRNGTNYDIYAQRVNASGVPQWTLDGVALSTAANDQVGPTIISDGAGGAVVTWRDFRSGTNYRIYAQRVESRYGEWGRPEPTLDAVADVPGDQGGKVKVNWYASGRDVLNQQFISHYSIWRATDLASAASASLEGIPTVRLSDIGREVSGPALREAGPTADYFWELIGTQDAIYRTAYAVTASTTHDATSLEPAVHQFQIVARAYFSQYINWPSNIVSGFSVDNLAPTPPFALTAQRVGADVHLKWKRAVAPDLRDYAIYRGTSSGVTPDPIHFLANSEDTLAVDVGAPTSTLYYIVTAYDVHENQSDPSNEASVSATTGVGGTPSITALAVLDNAPNPFASTTMLRVGLPRASEVAIEVFDVAGRRVRSERTNALSAGWRDVVFDARDAGGRLLPSGVYFYRIQAAGETITRKMVIAR